MPANSIVNRPRPPHPRPILAETKGRVQYASSGATRTTRVQEYVQTPQTAEEISSIGG